MTIEARRCRRPLQMILAALALWLAAAPAQAADPAAGFYAGKTIQVLIGYGPGGGYDLYARLLARHMGRHIPGNPTLVPQNMPGAGSLKLVNYLYAIAPKDGTVIGTFSRGLAMEPLLGRSAGAQFDATKFTWVGSVTNEVSVCALWADSGVVTWHDMETRPDYVIGGTASGGDDNIYPVLLKRMFHLPLRRVNGYVGTADVDLALERHEIDGRCGWSWQSLVARIKPLYDSKRIAVTLQFALQKHEDLPDVPLILDQTQDPKEIAALRLILSRQSMARPFAAPPGLPPARAQALRTAFDETMRDAEFLAEAKQLNLEVRPVSGAEVEALVKTSYAAPPEVVKLASDSLRELNEP